MEGYAEQLKGNGEDENTLPILWQVSMMNSRRCNLMANMILQ